MTKANYAITITRLITNLEACNWNLIVRKNSMLYVYMVSLIGNSTQGLERSKKKSVEK